jgi:hypothetical protein
MGGGVILMNNKCFHDVLCHLRGKEMWTPAVPLAGYRSGGVEGGGNFRVSTTNRDETKYPSTTESRERRGSVKATKAARPALHGLKRCSR